MPDPNEDQSLTGDDVLLIIEALDAYIFRGRDAPPWERQDYDDFALLRARLNEHVGMSMDDQARQWLRIVLGVECEGQSAASLSKMLTLLSEPTLKRGDFRQAMVKALRISREFQFYKPSARVTSAYHATNRAPEL
jgi:hypothetical protein